MQNDTELAPYWCLWHRYETGVDVVPEWNQKATILVLFWYRIGIKKAPSGAFSI